MKRCGFEKGVLQLVRLRNSLLSELGVEGHSPNSLETLILAMSLVHVLSLLGVVPRRTFDLIMANQVRGSRNHSRHLLALFETAYLDQLGRGSVNETSEFRRPLALSPFAIHAVPDQGHSILSNRRFEELAAVLQEVVPPPDNGGIDGRILMLGYIYELLRNHESRRQQGIFYTPAKIAGRICDLALTTYESSWTLDAPGPDPCSVERLIALKVADNSCGTGVFLVTMLDRLAQLAELAVESVPRCRESMISVGIDPRSQISVVQHILGKCIHGRDMDETALKVAATQLWLYAVHRCGQMLSCTGHSNLTAANTLAQGKSDPTCFDIIVGNPPYMRASLLPDDVKLNLRGSYPVVREYNSHALFIDSALDHLNAGGVLGYIVHKNVFTLDSFKALRERLLVSYHCTDLIDCGLGAFKGVTAETGVLVLKKVAMNPSLNTRLFRYTVASDTMNRLLVLSQNDYTCLVRPWNYRYLLSASRDDVRLLRFLEKLPRVAERGEVRRGIETGDNRRYLTDSPAGDCSWTPVLRGRDISPFRSESSVHIYYSRESLAKPGPKDMQWIPKVVVQQNARNPIACYDEGRSLVLNSATYISGAHPDILKSLCVFLNSGLVSWFFRKVMTNNAMITVNVLPNNLGQTPIPLSFNRGIFAWLCDLLMLGAAESSGSEAMNTAYQTWWKTIGEAVVVEAYLPELFPSMGATEALSSFILDSPLPEHDVLTSSRRQSLSAIADTVLTKSELQPLTEKGPPGSKRTVISG